MNPFCINKVTITKINYPLRQPFITALGEKTHTTNISLGITLKGGVLALQVEEEERELPAPGIVGLAYNDAARHRQVKRQEV